ncbi:MAG: TraC family protein [Patescibacteria group bacterium]
MVASKSSQDFVPVKEVRDGVLILKDGSIRRILMASSLNFALKSAPEQESIIYQFQTFLNSIDFSVQIFIQSRRYDIRPYLAILEEREREQLNDLLKIQTREYINFIQEFMEMTNIMTKNFFVVVPYASAKSTLRGGGFPFFSKRKMPARERLEDFEEEKTQLDQRAYVVQQGLARCGVRTEGLGTEEVIELLYRMFNPGEQEKPLAPKQP